MYHALKSSRLAWLAIGLLGGLILGGFWPYTPLHAVATDRYDTFAIATGFVDPANEAIYFLDFLTGDLRAAVLNQMGKFGAFYQYNILGDLGVDASKNPRFLMVTGVSDLRRPAGTLRPSQAVVYVAEITTGKVAAYAIPWAPEKRAAGLVIGGQLLPLDVKQFRTAAVRSQGAPP